MQLTCVELGAELAAAARRNLAAYPNATVITGAFETTPAPGDRFDLVFAATSWHWLDPDLRYRRASELLNVGGHLAFWSASHVFPDGGDPIFLQLQDVYEEIGEAKADDRPRPGELPDSRAEIEDSGLFEVTAIAQLDPGGLILGRRVPATARHLLEPHHDGAMEAGTPLQRGPATPGTSRRRSAPPPLGGRAARRSSAGHASSMSHTPLTRLLLHQDLRLPVLRNLDEVDQSNHKYRPCIKPWRLGAEEQLRSEQHGTGHQRFNSDIYIRFQQVTSLRSSLDSVR